MINYRNTITVSKRQNDEWYIDTDKGDRYQTFAVMNSKTVWTEWWQMQHQSDLRLWQKDILREFANRYFEDLSPYVVYKSQHGRNQPHDIALAHSDIDKVWLLMTQHDFWLIKSDWGEITVKRGQDSMGSILDENNRKHLIYPILDGKMAIETA